MIGLHTIDLAALVSENYIGQSHFYKIVVPNFEQFLTPYLLLAFTLSFTKISEFFVALFYFLKPTLYTRFYVTSSPDACLIGTVDLIGTVGKNLTVKGLCQAVVF